MNAIRPVSCVIRAEELPLYHDASSALAAARVAADELLSEAKRQADAERAGARAEGLAAAQTEATQLLAVTAANARRQLDGLCDAIAAAIADGVAAVIGDLDLSDSVARAAAYAVATLQEQGRVTVRVAPSHAATARGRLAHDAEFCRVVEDATLGPDDCVVETEAGTVRAGINAQLTAMRNALRQAAGGAA
jgi:type III secretion protein L